MQLDFTSDHTIEADSASALDALLGPNLTLPSDGSVATFDMVRLPNFVTPDGAIVASDGLILESTPFVEKLEPGPHPLRLAVARVSESDGRIAFAILGDLAAKVERFELALVAGQTMEALKPGNYYGYPVDSGTGSFASMTMHAKLRMKDDLYDEVAPVMEEVYQHTRDWCSAASDTGSAAMFSSGFGDGLYPSYFGYDESGKAVMLVTDFNVVIWPRCPIQPIDPPPESGDLPA